MFTYGARTMKTSLSRRISLWTCFSSNWIRANQSPVCLENSNVSPDCTRSVVLRARVHGCHPAPEIVHVRVTSQRIRSDGSFLGSPPGVRGRGDGRERQRQRPPHHRELLKHRPCHYRPARILHGGTAIAALLRTPRGGAAIAALRGGVCRSRRRQARSWRRTQAGLISKASQMFSKAKGDVRSAEFSHSRTSANI